MDKKYASSKQSFKQVRGNAKPPLTEIKEVIQDFVKVIPLDEPHNFEILVNIPIDYLPISSDAWWFLC